jgi:(4S)-4-hydroxy-5-phosphonooxypentane-2,3-dione isomerase
MNRPTFAITVTFELVAGHRDRFLELVGENAATSLRAEPGCHRFDVLIPEREDAVFLYEIYTDRAAFDAHLASDHFKAFNEATAGMVAGKTITPFALLEPAGG